jgi:hypothetical protein
MAPCDAVAQYPAGSVGRTARDIDGGYIKAWFREGCALTEMVWYVSNPNTDMRTGITTDISRRIAQTLSASDGV